MSTITERTPVEIDTVLYPLYAERYSYSTRRHELRLQIAKTVWPVEFKEVYERYIGRYSVKVWAIRNTERITMSDGRVIPSDLDRALVQLAELDFAIEAAAEKIAPLEAEYDRRPWNRFVIVPDGHIHTSFAGCGSLRPTTQRLLLIAASGSDADEVVRTYDFTACTKCFPNAPVAPAKVDPNQCTAGPYDYTKRHPTARYATCNECGYNGAVSSLGKLRKHKKDAAR